MEKLGGDLDTKEYNSEDSVDRHQVKFQHWYSPIQGILMYLVYILGVVRETDNRRPLYLLR